MPGIRFGPGGPSYDAPPASFPANLDHALERGVGLTLGNALRRTLLSAIQGAAIGAVKIEGVRHELSIIPGVTEDVTDILLNLKQVVLRFERDEPCWISLKASSEGAVGTLPLVLIPQITFSSILVAIRDMGATAKALTWITFQRYTFDAALKCGDEVAVRNNRGEFAAEPINADDAWQSLQKGQIVEQDGQQSIADGLKTNLKPRTWHFVKKYVSGILLASEQEILDAMYLTWERMKIIIEPSSAVALAVILKNRDLFAGRRIGVIVTGGNVDIKNCPGCDRGHAA